MMRRHLIAAALVVLPLSAPINPALAGGSKSEIVTGPALVIDGDTIMVSLRKIRLLNMDAPELAQTCRRDGQDWPCGQQAAQALTDLVTGLDVTCDLNGQHSYGRKLGTCRVGATDLGAWMVRQGWAVTDDRFGQDYRPQEAKARADRLGVWTGEFQVPCKFRGSC